MRTKYGMLGLAGLMVLGAWGCDTTGGEGSDGPSAELKQQAVSAYADVVYANYTASLNKANAMKTSIDAFVEAPDQAKFDAAIASMKADGSLNAPITKWAIGDTF